jgi:CMP-N-acetylneuraminic acid synthetase
MKTAIIILARGQYSKRIPYKPLVDFMGKPLIEWTLSITDQLPYDTYVYTDMDEIKNVCKKYSCNVRDKILESEEGLHRTQEELQEYNKEIQADIIILMQVTSPLRDINKIQEWIKKFHLGLYDCGIAAYRLEDGFYYNEHGLRMNYYINERAYNQDKAFKQVLYKETGSFYIFKAEQISKNHITDTHNLVIFEDPYNIDINTYQDLERARAELCAQE